MCAIMPIFLVFVSFGLDDIIVLKLSSKLTRSVNLRYPAQPVKAIKETLNVLKSSTNKKLMVMFDLLFDHFGPQNWWPGETDVEIMVGAVLTQNTNWTNVEKAINNLKTGKLLSVEAIEKISAQELAEKIRPAGYYNIKASRLKNLIHFIAEEYDGNIGDLFAEEMETLRERLLSITGIGPETADSIMLYAANRPVFVVDAYTYRILNRHGMADEQLTYYELQDLFMESLTEDPELFNEFHALIVRTGKEYCRKKPRCDICPLENWERTN